MMKKLLLLLIATLFLASFTHAEKYNFVVLETNLGKIKLKLYENTPQHSENFLKQVKDKHYDGLLFHRVIKDFMIQAGSSDSRNAEKGKLLGAGGSDRTIEAEITPANFHKKGALCAARQSDQVNPEKRSSGEQFYIVQGKIMTDQELDMMQNQRLMNEKNKFGMKLFMPRQEEYKKYMQSGQKTQADSLVNTLTMQIEEHFKDYKAHIIPAEIREIYKTVGGTPFLDNEYTVFGEVIEGLDIVDKIAAQKTGQYDRPEEDIIIIKATVNKK